MQKSYPYYAFLTLFILTWWSLAFKENGAKPLPFEKKKLHSKETALILSPFSRELIQQALSGDLKTIVSLIQEWQTDADLLEVQGVKEVKTLSKEKYLRALSIGRHLSLSKEETAHRFLPQTYASASILLALSDVDEIVSIPKGLRDLTTIYPKALTDQIPLNSERDSSEKLYLKKPDLAFVSNYSHPSTLKALENQGIALFTLPSLETIQEIIDTIGQLGEITDHPLKGELLQIFVEATFLAIDNRIQSTPAKKILFLTHMNTFSLPGKKTLTGQLLTRLGISSWGPQALLEEKNNDWSIPLSIEQIVNYEPDSLIISSFEQESIKHKMNTEKGFQKLPKNLIFVDEVIQTFPSQFIALAYFDLAKAYLELKGETL